MDNFCNSCGAELKPAAHVIQSTTEKKSHGCLIAFVVALAASIGLIVLLVVIGSNNVPSVPKTHTVIYKVNCGSVSEKVPCPAQKYWLVGADLTYQNASGGTNQAKVQLPWSLEMENQESGKFLYISAQKDSTYSSLYVEIDVDGIPIQQAHSGGDYGIASASGRVP